MYYAQAAVAHVELAFTPRPTHTHTHRIPTTPTHTQSSSHHRVEVAVICWPVTLDRDSNYWTVLYCLQVRVQYIT